MLKKNQKRTISAMSFLLIVMMIPALHAGEYDRIFYSLWLGKAPKIESGKNGWRQCDFVLKTFDVTAKQVSDILKAHGFSEKNHSDMKRNAKKCRIALWKKADHQIIIMLVEQEIGKTLFSWGEMNGVQ